MVCCLSEQPPPTWPSCSQLACYYVTVYLCLSPGGVCCASGSSAAAGTVTPTRLRVEYTDSPQGLDVPSPRFSWALTSQQRGAIQSAYELRISATPPAAQFSWLSGRVPSNETLNVRCSGILPLPEDSSFTFSVTVWDAGGGSQTASSTFTTGISDWAGARWIGLAGTTSSAAASGFQARKAVKFAKPVRRAFAYVSGLGYYKLDIDGVRASNHELGSFTTFEKRVLYDTLDVTQQAATASALNRPCVFGATVGPGWYTLLGVGFPTLRLRLSVVFQDGTTEQVVSNDSWLARYSPVVSSNIYDGEVYNASRETPGWTTSEFAPDATWVAAALLAGPPGGHDVKYSSHAVLPPIRIGQSYAPCDMWQVDDSPGTYLFDFCQNMAGFTTFNLKEGIFSVANITQIHAEATHGPKPAGIYNQLASYTKQTNSYLTRGDGRAAQYTPLFTFAVRQSYIFEYDQSKQ